MKAFRLFARVSSVTTVAPTCRLSTRMLVYPPTIYKSVFTTLPTNFVRFTQTTIKYNNDRPIQLLIDEGQIEYALALIDGLAVANSPVSLDIYTKIFRILADEIPDAAVFGQLAIKYLKQINDVGYSPSKAIYDIMIDGFGKCGSEYVMKKVISMMTDRNIEPNIDTFNIILKNYGNRKEIDQMFKTFDEIKSKFSPDLTTYNHMIYYLGRSNNIDTARKYYTELFEKGLLPNVTTFHNILFAVTQGTKFTTTPTRTLALDYFEDMKKYGVEPDFKCLAYLAAAHSSNAEFQKLEQVVLKANSLPSGDTEAYNIMLAAFHLAVQFDGVLQQYKQMKSKSVKPDATTYEILFRACADNSRPDLITTYWEEMVNNGVMSEELLRLVVSLYLQCRETELAVNALYSMRSYGVIPQNETFIQILNGYHNKQVVASWIKKLQTTESLDKEEGLALKKFLYKVILNKNNKSN